MNQSLPRLYRCILSSVNIVYNYLSLAGAAGATGAA